MVPLALLLLGVEVDHLDSADVGVASSLDALLAGGWTLPPYEGPAVQPIVGLRKGHAELVVGPGVHVERGSAVASDGRSETFGVLMWRVEGRAAWLFGPALVGVDGALSDGRLSLGGKDLAQGTRTAQLGPTAGLCGQVAPGWELVVRARYPLTLLDEGGSHGIEGAVAVQWVGPHQAARGGPCPTGASPSSTWTAPSSR